MSYIKVTNGAKTASATIRNVQPAKPYLKIGGGYLPLSTGTINDRYIKINKGDTTYRILNNKTVTKTSYQISTLDSSNPSNSFLTTVYLINDTRDASTITSSINIFYTEFAMGTAQDQGVHYTDVFGYTYRINEFSGTYNYTNKNDFPQYKEKHQGILLYYDFRRILANLKRNYFQPERDCAWKLGVKDYTYTVAGYPALPPEAVNVTVPQTTATSVSTASIGYMPMFSNYRTVRLEEETDSYLHAILVTRTCNKLYNYITSVYTYRSGPYEDDVRRSTITIFNKTVGNTTIPCYMTSEVTETINWSPNIKVYSHDMYANNAIYCTGKESFSYNGVMTAILPGKGWDICFETIPGLPATSILSSCLGNQTYKKEYTYTTTEAA